MNGISIEKLDGENYSAWCVQMKSLLITLDCWFPVETTCLENWTAVEKATFAKSDRKALALITLNVKSSELLYIKDCANSKLAWERLDEIYNARGPARKVSLFKNLVRFQIRRCEKFSTQINKFCSIVESLRELQISIPDDLLSILLLCSLPEEMENFVVAIEARDELPTLVQLKCKLLEEEHRRTSSNVAENNVNLEAERVLSINSTKQKSRRGHEKRRCYTCGVKGHISTQCKNKNKSRDQNSNAVLGISSAKSDIRDQFILDSGASNHMCCEKNFFVELREYNDEVMLATGEKVRVQAIGNVKLKSVFSDITLIDVFYVPQLHSNFLSVAKIVERGNKALFMNGKAVIKNKFNKVLFNAPLQSNIYKAELYKPKENSAMQVSGTVNDKLRTWHQRFGHINCSDLLKLFNENMIKDKEKLVKSECFSCEICATCKIKKTSFPSYKTVLSKQPLEIIHSDLCGPMRVKSQSGSLYFMSFIDDFTRYAHVYFLKHKSEALECLKNFVVNAENQIGKRLKILRTDNGREYVNEEMRRYLSVKGITHQTTIPYTPEQNGIAERYNRTIVEMARCMLEQSKLPHSLWSEAVNTATYVRNRSPTKVLKNITPFERWVGRKPYVGDMKVFGCDAVALNKKLGKSKFERKGDVVKFVGYARDCKAYRLYDFCKKSIIVARDVIFFEQMFTTSKNYEQSYNDTLPLFNQQDVAISSEVQTHSGRDGEDELATSDQNKGENDGSDSDPEPIVNPQGRIKRGRPKLLRSGTVGRPRKVFAIDPGTNVLNSVACVRSDPITIKEALNSENAIHWKKAMESELATILNNNTWNLVDPPENKNIIGCKWVFATKRRPDGSVEKYKARLVAQGCSQRENIDYFDTYSPVVRHATIRLILALSAKHQLLVHHFDIAAAYLNGELKEEVYMRQPVLFEDKEKPHSVCRLKKSIYGLKQAGRDWSEKINDILVKIGFNRSKSDCCVFYRISPNDINIIGVYVDDLIVASSSSESISNILSKLNESVQAVDRGPIQHYLGMQIERDGSRGEIKVHQKSYVGKLLDEWGMLDCKSALTPIPSGCILQKCSKLNCTGDHTKQFQSLMGALTYLSTISRPDISFAVSKLSQFCSHAHHEHFVVAKHILRYLKHTVDVCLCYSNSNNLVCYTDSDWASDDSDRKSCSGFVLMFGDGPIQWESKKQNVIALSSTEAEYISTCQAAKEVMFVRNLLKEIGFNRYVKFPTIIYCDNQGAAFLAKNETTKKRSKHIDIKYHYIREKCNLKELNIEYVSTTDNVADGFTKSLSKVKHNTFCSKLFTYRETNEIV